MIKIVPILIFLFAHFNGKAGYFENEKKVLLKDCLKYFEKGKKLNIYINRYSIGETVERSDEYYEFIYSGKYYNLFFGYKIYDKKFKYITNSECVTIDFDKENRRQKNDDFNE